MRDGRVFEQQQISFADERRAGQGRRSGLDVYDCALRYRLERVVDLTMLPQHDRVVLVTLLDGRQLEGALIARTDYFEIAGTGFYDWEVEELEDVA